MASIILCSKSPAPCEEHEPLTCDWTDCNTRAKAVVTDDYMACEDTPFCEDHLVVYLGDVIPTLKAHGEKVLAADPSWG